MRLVSVVLSGLFLMWSSAESSELKTEARWYTGTQLETGQKVFLANCAVCHGKQAQGLAGDWRLRLSDGSYPPPPLNGTAHAWHHPLSQLRRSVREGGVRLGGKMPGFKGQLNTDEQLAAIAYFQSFWTDDLYEQWAQRGGVEK
jgi:mono/diheme cytochrome c family protein